MWLVGQVDKVFFCTFYIREWDVVVSKKNHLHMLQYLKTWAPVVTLLGEVMWKVQPCWRKYITKAEL